MSKQLWNLAIKFWRDDCGSIIASEYVMVGTVAVLGTASGVAAIRDATNAELQDYGNSIRVVRQQYTPMLQKTGVAPRTTPTYTGSSAGNQAAAPVSAGLPACNICP